jgi:hypothetical protein
MEASAGMSELVRAQPGACASVTWTFDSVDPPSFVTTIVNVAVPPLEMVCDFGFFVIEMCGTTTVTGAVSVAVTSSPPPTGVPVAVALLVKLAGTFANEQV